MDGSKCTACIYLCMDVLFLEKYVVFFEKDWHSYFKCVHGWQVQNPDACNRLYEETVRILKETTKKDLDG